MGLVTSKMLTIYLRKNGTATLVSIIKAVLFCFS